MTPRFAQEIGSVSLATVIAHAYEIQRSDGMYFPDLWKYPEIYSAASRLIAAHRMNAPESDLVQHATELNDTLTYVRAQKSIPKSSKPTVGKATDRLGEKGRRVEKKITERAEKRERAKASKINADALFGGLS